MDTDNKRHPVRTAILVILLIALLLGAAYYFGLAPAITYLRADYFAQNGSWEEAAELFESLGDYRDAATRAAECRENLSGVTGTETAAEKTEVPAAAETPAAEETVTESPTLAQEAAESLAAGDYAAARELYTQLGDTEGVKAVDYAEGVAALESGSYERALELLKDLDHPDAPAALERLRRAAPALFLKDAKAGDYVSFGSFEQDNATAEAEAIEWLVLERNGDTLYLISRYCLAARPFNDTYTCVTWETCSLRKWLNGDFYNTAFSDAERGMIQETVVSTPDNGEYLSSGGEDTKDNVHIMSVAEAQKYFPLKGAASAEPTALCKAQGAFTEKGCAWWWLRDMGGGNTHGTGVTTTGLASLYNADPVNSTGGSVRPVIYVKVG